MQLLLIDADTRDYLKKLKDFAEKNPYTYDDLFDIKNGDARPPGEIDGYWCMVPVGFKVVFTIELQKHTVRHLSVSVPKGLPNPFMCKEIMKILGFQSPLEKCVVKMGTDERYVEILEIIK